MLKETNSWPSIKWWTSKRKDHETYKNSFQKLRIICLHGKTHQITLHINTCWQMKRKYDITYSSDPWTRDAALSYSGKKSFTIFKLRWKINLQSTDRRFFFPSVTKIGKTKEMTNACGENYLKRKWQRSLRMKQTSQMALDLVTEMWFALTMADFAYQSAYKQ